MKVINETAKLPMDCSIDDIAQCMKQLRLRASARTISTLAAHEKKEMIVKLETFQRPDQDYNSYVVIVEVTIEEATLTPEILQNQVNGYLDNRERQAEEWEETYREDPKYDPIVHKMRKLISDQQLSELFKMGKHLVEKFKKL